MKTLIKKEIRLLLPAWILAMVLVTATGFLAIASLVTPVFEQWSSAFYTLLAFTFGALFLGINSFGQELSSNTFSAFLSQPVNRQHLWHVKIATLAVAFVSVWLVAIAVTFVQFDIREGNPFFSRPNHLASFALFEYLTLSALVTFSGGLWTTLLLRQTTTAFWFTFLVPLAIIFGIATVLQEWVAWGRNITPIIAGALVLYSIAGFFLAWKLFMRAQDIRWTGGEICLPLNQRFSKVRASSRPVRPGHWFSALVWKEIQLHQGVFVIAAIVLLLHLTADFLRRLHPHFENPAVEFILGTVWVLWLLVPLLVGATAIAEERRIGTLEPQLCLPASRRSQLLIKFFIALMLSLFFGALIPVLIEGTKTLDQWDSVFVMAAAIFCISFYASSLGLTTLQSIGWAILFALVMFARADDLWFIPIQIRNPIFPILDNLTRALDAAVLLIVFGCLTYFNFKHVHQNWKFWLPNFLAFPAVYFCLRILNHEIATVGMRWYDAACLYHPFPFH